MTELNVEGGMHIDETHTPREEGAENPRDAIMRQAVERANANREAEARQGSLDIEGALPYSDELNAPPPTEVVQEAPAESELPKHPDAIEAEQAQLPPAPYKVLKVDGREVPIASEEDLIRLAQQGMSSQQRFQEAARMRQEAQQLQQQPLAQLQQPQQQAPQQQAQLPSGIDPDLARSIAHRISYGNEEEQASAIQELAQRVAPQQPSYSPEQIAQYSAQLAMHQMQANQEFQNKLVTIGNEFPDIFQDRQLSILAGDTLNQIRERDTQLQVQRSDLEQYREACSLVQTKFVAPTKAVVEPVVVPATKLAAKAAAPQIVRSAGRTVSSTTQKEVTSSDIVEQMRKQRGQPSMR